MDACASLQEDGQECLGLARWDIHGKSSLGSGQTVFPITPLIQYSQQTEIQQCLLHGFITVNAYYS